MRYIHSVKTGKRKLVPTTDEWLLENRPNYIELTVDKPKIVADNNDTATVTVTMRDPLGIQYPHEGRVFITVTENDVTSDVPVMLSNGMGTFTVTADDMGYLVAEARDFPTPNVLRVYGKEPIGGTITTSVTVSGGLVLIPEHRLDAFVNVAAVITGEVLVTRHFEASVAAKAVVSGTLSADWKLGSAIEARATVDGLLEVHEAQ